MSPYVIPQIHDRIVYNFQHIAEMEGVLTVKGLKEKGAVIYTHQMVLDTVSKLGCYEINEIYRNV